MLLFRVQGEDAARSVRQTEHWGLHLLRWNLQLHATTLRYGGQVPYEQIRDIWR